MTAYEVVYEVETWDTNVHLEVFPAPNGVTVTVYQRREHDDAETPLHLSPLQAAKLAEALRVLAGRAAVAGVTG